MHRLLVAVELAWTDGGRLYLHAGLRSKIAQSLISEIYGRISWSREVTFNDFTAHLNALLQKAVRSKNFSLPIFLAGKSRGGTATIGGVLWEDISELKKSAHALDIRQIIAHNPPQPSEQLIRVTPENKLLCVDAGLCEHYGGNRAFAELRDKQIIVQEKQGSFWNLWLWKRWYSKTIPDPV